MYSKTTKKINITVKPYYLEDQSEPEDQHYVWAYKVIIDNHDYQLLLYTPIHNVDLQAQIDLQDNKA